MKSKILFSISCLCLALTARGGTLLLLSGESYDGKLQFVNNQIVVNSPQSGSTTVDVSNILDAVFHTEHKSRAEDLPPGARLINGTLIAGPVATLDLTATTIKLGDITVPMNSVAWIVFAPIPRDKIPKPSTGQTGAILPSGDFFPGIFGGIQDGRVAINSVLFGPQRFVIKAGKGGKGAAPQSQIAALVLRDIQSTAGRYEVIAKDGSTYCTDQVGTDHEGISIHDSIAGDVKIKNDSIYEIHLAASQYQYLSRVKPVQVDPPKGTEPAAAVSVAAATGAGDLESILTLANTAVTYAVPAGFTIFSSTVFLPKEAPPGARFTFAVYGDGKFLLSRSSAVAAGDSPQHLRVNVVNARSITLRMEPASPGFPAVSGKWAQPMFIKP